MQFRPRTMGGSPLEAHWLSHPFRDGVGYQIVRNEDREHQVERLEWVPSGRGGGGTHRHIIIQTHLTFGEAVEVAERDERRREAAAAETQC